MATVGKFEDLVIWQLARELCNDIYNLIESTSLGKNYSLRDQMDRCSGSVMDNIAEGFERNGNREFIQFLSVAKASCGELRSQWYRAYDRKHIDKDAFIEQIEKTLSLSKKISAFMTYLINSDQKGSKFNRPKK